jgi:hypothetical protein
MDAFESLYLYSNQLLYMRSSMLCYDMRPSIVFVLLGLGLLGWSVAAELTERTLTRRAEVAGCGHAESLVGGRRQRRRKAPSKNG